MDVTLFHEEYKYLWGKGRSTLEPKRFPLSPASIAFVECCLSEDRTTAAFIHLWSLPYICAAHKIPRPSHLACYPSPPLFYFLRLGVLLLLHSLCCRLLLPFLRLSLETIIASPAQLQPRRPSRRRSPGHHDPWYF